MTGGGGAAGRAAALRREFDSQFARATQEAPKTDDFLLVRSGGLPYALRLAQLGGVAKARFVAAAPTRRREFLGLVGIRGTIVGVYGMATLLGGEQEALSLPWIALSSGSDPVALAFERFDAFVRVEGASVRDDARPDTPGRFVRGVLQTASEARPIVDLASMFAAVRRSVGAVDSPDSPRRNP